MRKLALFLGFAALLAGGLAAAPTPVSAQQTIRVAAQALPPSRGNPYLAIGTPSIYVWSAMYDALTVVDEKGVTQPVLATKWENINPTTWRFTLRPNVKFSNGEAFDSKAVVAAFEYLRSETGSKTVVGPEVAGFADVKALSPMEVEFTTKAPDPLVPNRVAVVLIVAPGQWARLGPEAYANEPVGTGSFKVASWTPTEVTLVANPDSWRKPKADRLVIQGVGERATRVAALQSGQVEIALGLSPDNVPQVQSSGAKIDATPAPQVMSLAFFTEGADKSLADKRVRQALNYAVDREGIAKNLLGGLVKATGQGGTPVALGYDPEVKPYPYDPNKAKQLLAEAGKPNGFEMTAEVVVGTYPGDSELYQQMAADLAKVGVKVTLQQIVFADWLKKYLANGWAGPAFGLSWNTAPVLDIVRPASLFSCLKTPGTFYCDQEAVKLIQAANVEFDPKKRQEILARLAKLNYENPPALYLVEQVDLSGVSAKVSGFRNVNRYLTYHDMTVAR